MPNRPSKGGTSPRSRLQFGSSSRNPLDDPFKNVAFNELYSPANQEFFNTLEELGAPAEGDEIGMPAIDIRKRLFGFGPKLGPNNAEAINTQYGLQRLGATNEIKDALDLYSKSLAMDRPHESEMFYRRQGVIPDDATYGLAKGAKEQEYRTKSQLDKTSAMKSQVEGEDIIQNLENVQRARRADSSRAAGEAERRNLYSQAPDMQAQERQSYLASTMAPTIAARNASLLRLGQGDVAFSPEWAKPLSMKPGLFSGNTTEQYHEPIIVNGKQLGLSQQPSVRVNRASFNEAVDDNDPDVQRIKAGVAPSPTAANNPPKPVVSTSVVPRQPETSRSPFSGLRGEYSLTPQGQSNLNRNAQYPPAALQAVLTDLYTQIQPSLERPNSTGPGILSKSYNAANMAGMSEDDFNKLPDNVKKMIAAYIELQQQGVK